MADINREAAIRAIEDKAKGIKNEDTLNGLCGAIAILFDLPSVIPQEKTGHWIDRSDGGRIKYPWMEAHECDKCGEYGSAAWNFCPNCGADMRGDTE